MKENDVQNNNQDIFEGKKPDGLCRAGCILAIVFSSITLGFSFLYALGSLIIGFIFPYSAIMGIAGSIFLLIVGIMEIIPIILCSYVLKGKAQSNIAAGIVALIFSGVISGVFILVGKYENQKPQVMLEN